MDGSLSGEQRAEALASYRDLLGSLERHADTTRASVIHVGEESLSVDPWVRGHVLAGLGFDEKPESWESLLSDVVACCARSLVDLNNAGRGRLSPGARETLVLDAALGMCVLEECADTVARLTSGGRRSEAEGLGRFREQLSEVVDRVHARLHEDAADGATESTANPEPEPPRVESSSTLKEPAAEESTAEPAADLSHVPTREMLVRPERKSHTGILLVALVAAAAAWGGMTWWDHTQRVPAIPALTASDFGPVPGLADVAARPPRVFVYVEPASWLEMETADRQALLERLGGVAAGAGYTGVHVNAPDGRPLGTWTADGGAQSLDQAVSVSVPLRAPASERE